MRLEMKMYLFFFFPDVNHFRVYFYRQDIITIIIEY